MMTNIIRDLLIFILSKFSYVGQLANLNPSLDRFLKFMTARAWRRWKYGRTSLKPSNHELLGFRGMFIAKLFKFRPDELI